MSYPKSFLGSTYQVPEPDDENVGAAATAILDDLMDAVDGMVFLTVDGDAIQHLPAASTTLPNLGTLTPTHPVHKVRGTSGPVTLSGTQAIADGQRDGQTLRLQGDDAANTVTIQNGANVRLRGDITLGLYETIDLRWDAVVGDWIEAFPSRGTKFLNQQGVEFYEATGNGTSKVTLRAPASLAADYTLTLPVDDGNAGQILQTDGLGNLSWGNGSATLQSAYDSNSTITIGPGGAVTINRGTGGEAFRVTAATSGDPYLAVVAGTGETRLVQVASGEGRLGTFSNNAFSVYTNSVERLTVAASGEVGIGGATESGIKLRVAGDILIENNRYLKGELADASNKNLLGWNASNQLVLGDSSVNANVLIQCGTGAAVFSLGGSEIARVTSTGYLGVGQTAPTVKLEVLEPGNFGAVRVLKQGSGAGNAVFIDNDGAGYGLLIQQDGNSGTGLYVTKSIGGSGQCLAVNNVGGGTGSAVQIAAQAGSGALLDLENAGSTGWCMYVSQNVNAETVRIDKLATGGGTCLLIDNDGTGNAFKVQQDGNAIAVSITSQLARTMDVVQNADATGLFIDKNGAGTGVPLLINNAGSGKCIDTDAGAGTPAHLTNGGTWTNASCFREFKEDFEDVDAAEFLSKVSRMSIQRYRHKKGPRQEHKEFGPFQDDLVGLFGLSPEGVRPHEIAAIALVGIQALAKRVQELEAAR